MSLIKTVSLGLLATSVAMTIAAAPAAAQQQQKPNIIFIMGDDIGWFNVGAYNRGIMSGKTPNLDKLAAEGMMFTDYYAEASCTAGRANFITGELPIRTGMTTVGQAPAPTWASRQRPLRLRQHSKAWGMPPGSSAKTTSAT
jgi:arylsulfatase